ncbi:putative cytochrome 52A4 [Acrodontium crateriforme]|uniref:Cytochrome 52A4 n=1 Tax=Acrodontium crateriforme TaxID=150365 RepID=A0AAQ3R9I7_9PEZI|nr:putative cytochrome 52A4 [Acrodontium crateriforme]
MFTHFLDRTLWPAITYCSFAAGVNYVINHFVSNAYLTYVYAVLALATFLFVRTFVRAVISEYKLDRLGGRAPSRRSLTPFNVNGLIEAIRYFSNNKNAEWWEMIMSRNANKHRPFTVETITTQMRIIFTVDQDNIKAILASQFSDFGKGPRFREEWKEFLGLSIFTTDGELWHDSRNLIRPQFIRDRVSDLHTFETHIQNLLPALAGTHNGATVRCDDLFYRYTLDAVTDFLLGHSVDSLRNGQAEFATAFGEVQRVQSMLARAGPLYDFIPRQSFRKGLKVLNTFVDTYIDRTLQLSPEELEKNAKNDESYTFLHALAGYTRDRKVLRDQLVAVLLAGRDTTAATLSWLFYELSRHPQVVKKLRDEIVNSVGTDKQPTYADLKGMRYLQHTLNETLRLYPAVPYNVRVALKDTTLPRGGGPDGSEPVAVLEGTPVAYSTFIMQRRADIYPSPSSSFPDVESFAPDRWDGWTPKSWTYIPFNGGPRICIGQQFALTEMGYTVVRILQTFDRVECTMDGAPGMKADITLTNVLPINVAFFKSEQS